jgi:hypothetical protein
VKVLIRFSESEHVVNVSHVEELELIRDVRGSQQSGDRRFTKCPMKASLAETFDQDTINRFASGRMIAKK